MWWRKLKERLLGSEDVADTAADDLTGGVLTFPGEVGIWAKHLGTGQEIAIRADTPFFLGETASSLLLLGVVAALPDEASLEAKLTLHLCDYRGEGGSLGLRHIGSTFTVLELIRQVAEHGDLMALDRLEAYAGPDRLRQALVALGVEAALELQTPSDLLRHLLSDIDAAWATLPPHAAMAWATGGIADFLPPGRRPVRPDLRTFSVKARLVERVDNVCSPRLLGELLSRALSDNLFEEGWRHTLLKGVLMRDATDEHGMEAIPGMQILRSPAHLWPAARSVVASLRDDKDQPRVVIVILADQLEVAGSALSRLVDTALQRICRVLKWPVLELKIAANQPHIDILPLGRRVCYEVGDQPQIQWRTQNVKGALSLELVQTSAQGEPHSVDILASHLQDDNSFSAWVVPRDIAPGNTYCFRLRDLNHSDLVAWSEPFVLKGTIRVLFPHAGVEVLPGGPLDIRWESLGVTGKVSLILSHPQRQYSLGVVEDTGQWSGQIPHEVIPGESYRIRISSVVEPAIEGTGRPFYLGRSQHMVLPAPGTRLMPGGVLDIKWEGENGPWLLLISRGSGEEVYPLARGVGGGSWRGVVPKGLPDGGGYHVIAQDERTPTIQIRSSEVWIGHAITWSSPDREPFPFEGQPGSCPHSFMWGTTPVWRYHSVEPLPGPLKVDLYRGDRLVEVIEPACVPDGSVSVLIQRRWELGSGYRLHLSCPSWPTLSSWSPPFDIGGRIAVFVADQPLKAGESGEILWRCEGIREGISLELEGVQGSVASLASRLPLSGEWQGVLIPPHLPPGLYRVRGTALGSPALVGYSDWLHVVP